MTAAVEWAPGEMLAVAASRFIGNEDIAVVGLGLPQMAGLLAKRTHAPEASILLEIGVFEPMPTQTSAGIADPRIWEGAAAMGSMLDVLGRMLHGGRVTVGLLGALQVDPYGSINSTLVRDGDNVQGFRGSGGANDIVSLAERTLVVMRHQSRKFKPLVDFITSPGCRVDGRDRRSLGLGGRGPTAIITDRAVIEVSVDGAKLVSVHPGETPEGVLADTPMPCASGEVAMTDPPDAEGLKLLRTELDPEGWYTR